MYYYLSLLLIFLGVLIIGYAIFKLITSLRFIQRKTYEKRLIPNFYTLASLIMMILFFVSYTGVLIVYSGLKTVNINLFLISIIFFFGSIFVMTTVCMQKTLSISLVNKNYDIITTLINTVEAKDKYTKGHSQHVYLLVQLFYNQMPNNLKNKLDKYRLLDAAVLHDVGKISIPDAILNKPDKLTNEEYEIIKTHTAIGKKIIDSFSDNDIPKWVLYHHERIDGNGYYKIKGEDIPLESKIIAIADTFSVLYSDRVYRKGGNFEDSINILKSLKDTQLDGELVDIFCSIDKEKIIELEN